jgi:UMF1 family MFS transporter
LNNGKIDPVGRVAGVASYLRGLIRTYPETMKYLAACLIYKDGLIALLGLGGVYSAGVLGWGLVESILYGIWASIFGTIGGVFLAGPMDRTFGVRRAIIFQLAVMCAGVVIALGVTQESIFYGLIPSGFKVHDLPVFNSLSDVFYLALIAVIAAVATANISSSRYMMIVLAPKERSSEFFGLFALSSTATVWLGPMLTEFATRASGNQRIGFSPVLLLLGIGLALMFTLKAEVVEGQTAPPPGAAH